jgi:hypothetical protein
VEENKKKDEDEDYRNDADPKGYDLYEKSVSNIDVNFFQLKDPIQRAYEFASLVAGSNPESKELQAKVIPIFL